MFTMLLTLVGAFVATVGVYEGIKYVRGKYHLLPADSFEVESMLKERRMWDAFISGELKCPGCGNVVSFENLGTIAEEPETGNLDLVCRRPVCLDKYIRNLEAEMWDTPENAG